MQISRASQHAKKDGKVRSVGQHFHSLPLLQMNSATLGNIWDGIPNHSDAEEFKVLHQSANVRVERIVSVGHTTPIGEWFDQAWDEWVLVLRGAARITIEGEPHAKELGPGDWLMLPAHCRHRVDWTDFAQPTVWLAVHITGPSAPRG